MVDTLESRTQPQKQDLNSHQSHINISISSQITHPMSKESRAHLSGESSSPGPPGRAGPQGSRGCPGPVAPDGKPGSTREREPVRMSGPARSQEPIDLPSGERQQAAGSPASPDQSTESSLQSAKFNGNKFGLRDPSLPPAALRARGEEMVRWIDGPKHPNCPVGPHSLTLEQIQRTAPYVTIRREGPERHYA